MAKIDYNKLSDDTLQRLAQDEDIDYDSLSDEELVEVSKFKPNKQQNAQAQAPQKSITEILHDKYVAPTIKTVQDTATDITQKRVPSLVQNAEDTGRGYVKGFTFGGSDELAGGLESVLEAGQGTLHNMFPSMFDPSARQVDADLVSQGFTSGSPGALQPTLSDVYRDAQQDYKQIEDEAKTRSPYLFGGGEIAGGIASFGKLGKIATPLAEGKILGQGGLNAAKEIGKRAANAAPLGAAYGALDSEEGQLIGASPEQRSELLSDTAQGAITGSLVGATVPLAFEGSKIGAKKLKETASDYIEDSPILQKTTRAIKAGYDKIGFTGKQDIERLNSQKDDAIYGVTDQLYTAKDLLGKNIENVLQTARDNNVAVNVSQGIKDGITEALQNRSLSNRTLRNHQESIKKVLSGGSLDPVEANELRKALRDESYNLAGSNPKGYSDLRDTSQLLNSELENSVGSSFTEANKMFNKFLESAQETIVNKGKPKQYAQQSLSDLSKDKNKITNELSNIVEHAEKGTATGDDARKTLKALNDNLENFEKQYPGILKNIGVDPNRIQKQIKDTSMDYQLSSSMRGQRADEGVKVSSPTSIVENMIGRAGYGVARAGGRVARGITDTGSIVTKPVTSTLKLGKDLYNAGDDVMTQVVSMFRNNPKQQGIADSLEQAILTGDKVKKDAVIFSILQDPARRNYLFQQNPELLNSEPEE